MQGVQTGEFDMGDCLTQSCKVSFTACVDPGGCLAPQNSCSKGVVTHSCTSAAGQSGSPISNASYFVSSVLVGEVNDPPLLNVAARVTPEILFLLGLWAGDGTGG